MSARSEEDSSHRGEVDPDSDQSWSNLPYEEPRLSNEDDADADEDASFVGGLAEITTPPRRATPPESEGQLAPAVLLPEVRGNARMAFAERTLYRTPSAVRSSENINLLDDARLRFPESEAELSRYFNISSTNNEAINIPEDASDEDDSFDYYNNNLPFPFLQPQSQQQKARRSLLEILDEALAIAGGRVIPNPEDLILDMPRIPRFLFVERHGP